MVALRSHPRKQAMPPLPAGKGTPITSSCSVTVSDRRAGILVITGMSAGFLEVRNGLI